MTIEKEYKGYWFLPNKSENKIAGILYFKPNDKVKLELIGGFESKLSDVLKAKNYEVIYGITSSAEKITLFNCSSSFNLNFSSEYPLTNFKCAYFVLGKHLESFDDKIFNKIVVDMTSLYNWLPSGLIRHSISSTKDNKLEINFSISQKDYWEKSIRINDTTDIKFLCSFEKTKSNNDDREIILIENTLLEISKINIKSSFTELLNKVNIFKEFLSLASLLNINYLNIELFDNNDFQELKNGNKHIYPVSLYYVNKNEHIAQSRNQDFLYKYQDIESLFPNIIKKWYDVKNDLAPIRNHLIESVIPKQTFTSLDFLILVQALEGFHRRFINDKKTNLNKRITFLINKFKDVQKVNLDTNEILWTVGSRDYYSHFFEKNKETLEGLELSRLSEKLRILLICCVLNLIGFNIDKINLILNKNYKV